MENMENKNIDTMNTCPCCSKHCDRNALQCGKGERYFHGENAEENKDRPERNHRHEGRHAEKNHGHEHRGRKCGEGHHREEGCHGGKHGEGHRHEEDRHSGKHGGEERHGEKHRSEDHRHPEFPEGSLAQLLAKCTRRLYRSGDMSLLDVLTEEEKTSLQALLSKLIP